MTSASRSKPQKLLFLSNLCLVLATFGCPAGGDDGEADDEIGSDESTDSSGAETTTDATETETGTDTETGDGDGDVECFDGVPPLPFDSSATEVGYDLVAPDFAVDELRGPQSLSGFWTGRTLLGARSKGFDFALAGKVSSAPGHCRCATA